MCNKTRKKINKTDADCILFITYSRSQNDTIQDIINYKNNSSILYYLITTTQEFPSIIPLDNICFLKLQKNIQFIIKEFCLKILKSQINNFIITKVLKHEKIEVVTPHLMHIPSNYVINNFFIKNSNIIVSNYPDGIAQLYNSRTTWNLRYYSGLSSWRLLTRYFIGSLIGLKYHISFETIFNSYKRLDRIYTYLKDLLPYSNNADVIEITPNKRKINGTNIMIIGEVEMMSIEGLPYDKALSQIFYEQILTDNENANKIFYKSHPSKINDPILDYIKNNNIAVKIIDKNEILEKCIEKFKCNTVMALGSYSTAFINLRLVYDKEINLILIESEISKSNFNYKKLSEIFNALNIEKITMNIGKK